ncbi:CLUMA_CG020784, isoform A [Clunio marinus]|uniref:CLUMA_CG020784, isoform A n=1 Tax=Clunio marinus TaxID=568069 RepID=A0A1J1J8P0_9DIPT|nr:CLUMA_CG020784, isoform A [Clunio marinus]
MTQIELSALDHEENVAIPVQKDSTTQAGAKKRQKVDETFHLLLLHDAVAHCTSSRKTSNFKRKVLSETKRYLVYDLPYTV